MLTLIETLTGFAAIMLMLSLLVKTLTSVMKNRWDYYSDNLEHEVKRLVLEASGKTWDELLKGAGNDLKNVMGDIHWERLGEEILSAKNMDWLLKKMGSGMAMDDLEARLKIHLANVKYTFEMRMKNLALAVGVGLCLLCNINAFTIWKSLYSDQQLRATFSNAYAEKASKLAEDDAKAGPGNQGTASPSKEELDTQLTDFRSNMKGFLTDVSFGIGRIWREPCLMLLDENRNKCEEARKKPDAAAATAAAAQNNKKRKDSTLEILFYEFFGSLLTGILVSIGAPYWHDFLQAVSSLRSFFGGSDGQKAPAKP